MNPRQVVIGVAGVMVALALAASPAAAKSAAPYTDEHAVGVLTLCDRDNQPVDHGRVDAAPFVWAAVSPLRAPAPYDGEGRTASLFAYQPREGLPPGQWSGDMLTATTRYSTPDHPVAKLTEADGPLQEFVDAYPPSWKGFVQLRLYLGAPNQPPHTQDYAALDIRVSGDTWTAAESGTVACADGQGTSVEDLLPTADPSKAISGATLTTLAPAAAESPSVTTSRGDRSASATNATSSHGAAAPLGVAAALAAAAAGSVLTIRRIRRRATESG